MNWYRQPYSESRFLLSVPNFNVFHLVESVMVLNPGGVGLI